MKNISWNEIQDRATEFASKWQGETYEKGESQSFWSDFRYTSAVFYSLVQPEATESQKAEVKKLAQAILDARAEFPSSSLADLYDPLTMPPALAKSHKALDRAVDRLYRKEPFTTDADRVAMLFEKYKEAVA